MCLETHPTKNNAVIIVCTSEVAAMAASCEGTNRLITYEYAVAAMP